MYEDPTKHPRLLLTPLERNGRHAYFGINRAIIWRTIQDDVPPLRSAIQRLLDDLAVEETRD